MSDSSRSGTNTGGVLLIVFVTLKLAGVVAWPWVWVLCPIWVPLVFVVFALCCAFVAKVLLP